MATLSFCGATGKCMRGQRCERYRWQHCTEPERPAGREEDGPWNNCFRLRCRLYLTAWRSSNLLPYRWRHLVVTSSEEAESNRRLAGETVRKEMAEKRHWIMESLGVADEEAS
jgi:hypothetical protein